MLESQVSDSDLCIGALLAAMASGLVEYNGAFFVGLAGGLGAMCGLFGALVKCHDYLLPQIADPQDLFR